MNLIYTTTYSPIILRISSSKSIVHILYMISYRNGTHDPKLGNRAKNLYRIFILWREIGNIHTHIEIIKTVKKRQLHNRNLVHNQSIYAQGVHLILVSK